MRGPPILVGLHEGLDGVGGGGWGVWYSLSLQI